MKTSYFANFRKLDKNKYIAVSIARITPVGFDIKVEEFAPEKSTLFNYKNGKINEEQYTKEYTEQLDELFDDGIMVNTLSRLNNLEKRYNKEVVLLCYEGKEKFCHRHILSKYINDKFNLDIREI